MSQKPIDQIAKSIKPQGQDGIWVEIRKLNVFTATQIAKATDISRKTITDYIARLEAGKIVEKHRKYEETKMFVLIRDAGVHAPRLKKDGSRVTQGDGNKNLWRSMKMLKTFTPFDLAMHSANEKVTVSEETARAYCGMLLKAQYLKVMQKAVPGKNQATYRLVNYTGPKPPKIQRVKAVFDPNLNKVVYYAEARQ